MLRTEWAATQQWDCMEGSRWAAGPLSWRWQRQAVDDVQWLRRLRSCVLLCVMQALAVEQLQQHHTGAAVLCCCGRGLRISVCLGQGRPDCWEVGSSGAIVSWES